MSDCVRPPAIDELELLRHLDGAGTAETRDHLRQCAYCTDRLQGLSRLEGRLASGLHRADCPSSLALGEFQLGILPRDRAEAIRSHLTLCPYCPAELTQLEGFLQDVSPKGLPQKENPFRALIGRLLSSGAGAGAMFPALAPAWSAARGAGENARVYQAEEVQVALEVLPDAGDPETRTLIGLLLGVDPAGWRADLWEGDRHVAQTAVDAIGNFEFAKVVPAGYDLVMRGPRDEVTLPSLDLQSS